MPFRRTDRPMPQINGLTGMQDKYIQSPYVVHQPNNTSWYQERGYTPSNMEAMVGQGLGEYYGGQTRLPSVAVQPPNAGPGGSYQWSQYNNAWLDQSKSGSWKPGSSGLNYWGAQYGQKAPGPQFRMRDFLQAIPQANRRQVMNQLNQLFRNR